MTVTVLMTRIVINILPPLSSPITVVKPYLLLGIGPDCQIVRVGITLQEGSLGVFFLMNLFLGNYA